MVALILMCFGIVMVYGLVRVIFQNTQRLNHMERQLKAMQQQLGMRDEDSGGPRP